LRVGAARDDDVTMPGDQTEERIAKNDAIFREANERIREAAAEHGIEDGKVPFICECADPACRRVVLLDLEEYREIRSNPRWFLNADAHDAPEADAARVVERRQCYLIVEKTGRAGDVAEALDRTDHAA
jgi:hypothetical protein